ncbi:hypothetical protein Btru_009399 [Bulinus truncatus]|nr:hypothetical protein Btru_009399 [Bulinus truncatus]
MKTPEPLINVHLYNKSSAISMDVVDVTEYNFGRYDVTIEFNGNETKTFTFYLIKEEVASAIKVTNTSNDIFDNVTVSTRWSRSLKQKYIQAKLFVTNSMNLTVGFESVDRNLTYYIISTKPVCVFHQNRSFTTKLGDEMNITLCERLTFTRAISIFVNDHQILNESHQHKSYSILNSNGETESRKLILKLTNITDDDIGNSTIRIALDNVCTIRTTIIINKQISFLGSAKRPIESTESMSYVSYTAPLVTMALCSTVCVIIVYLKKFDRGGLCRTLRHKLQAGSKKSQNGTYVNCEDVSENGYMNHLDLQPSRISMIGIPNITDDTHIYSNTRGIKEEISSTSSYENLKGRYFNREGLQYITISHGHTASSPAPHQLSQSSESVAYASIDSEKTKLIALK